MLGELIDDYTIKVVDVFAMPQSGTGVSVEAVDPVFQQKMVDMLAQTNRKETVVGWYHSHPGFGPWLSSVDVNTQQSFEQLNARAVAVVVDPVQSVKGKVVIDAFRIINPQTRLMGIEPRQTTSNEGHIHAPSIQAMIHGLDRSYYSINISYKKNRREANMLKRYKKNSWISGFQIVSSEQMKKENEKSLENLNALLKLFSERIVEEKKLTDEQKIVAFVGKINPRKHLEHETLSILYRNVNSNIAYNVNALGFGAFIHL